MVAQVERMQARGHERRVEHRDVDAGALQRLHRRCAREARIDIVDQHPHLDATAARLAERAHEIGADAVAVEDVGRHGNRAARAVDRLQHRRKGMRAVDQRLDRVAGQQAPLDHLRHQPRERHEVHAGVTRRELRIGAMAHHAATHAQRPALDAVDADERVGERPERRQHPDDEHPDRRRARFALVEDRMPGRRERGGHHRDGKCNVYRVFHRRHSSMP